MFNLATIYFFEENDFDRSIELLIKLVSQNYYFANNMLSLVLIKKYGMNYEKI